jgi:hypothetical protein
MPHGTFFNSVQIKGKGIERIGRKLSARGRKEWKMEAMDFEEMSPSRQDDSNIP